MKVTAFIRKTAAKNNVTDQARVYFRVRDVGGVDIKAASELSINPNHWSAERQGYKPRVALVSEDKRMGFEKDIQNITHLIAEKYHRGVDGNWLKGLIEEYHHPNINFRGGNPADEYLLSYQIQKYMDETSLAAESWKHHRDNLKRYSVTSVSVRRSCTSGASIFAYIPLPLTTSVISSCGCRKSTGMWKCIPYSIKTSCYVMSPSNAPRTACRVHSTASAPSSMVHQTGADKKQPF